MMSGTELEFWEKAYIEGFNKAWDYAESGPAMDDEKINVITKTAGFIADKALVERRKREKDGLQISNS